MFGLSACVKRGEFQECESPQLILGISVGAILYPSFFFLKSHRGPCLRHFKWRAAAVDPSLDESLIVCPPSTDVVVRVPGRKSFR